MQSITFHVFADLHYIKGQYPVPLSDIDVCLSRAAREGAELVLQLGDFSNDLAHSPEAERALLRNAQGLPVYGVYGNHELERAGNTMGFITPRLTNRPETVVFGTEDGGIGDGSVGYYYFDRGGFRFLALDNFNSLRPDGVWEHNITLRPRPGNTLSCSLGEPQTRFLRATLLDAAARGLSVIVFSHASFCPLPYREHARDAEAVHAIFCEANAARPHTVVLALNGHNHTNHFDTVDGISYFDVNVVRFGHWLERECHHYPAEEGFTYDHYDAEGRPAGKRFARWEETYGGLHGWFFRDPLSATVTVTDAGGVAVRGAKTSWFFDILPTEPLDGTEPEISDFDC